MSLPELPTDNLYKFKALSGLTLVVLAITLPSKMAHDVMIRSYEVKKEIALANIQKHVFRAQLDILDAEANWHAKHLSDTSKLLERLADLEKWTERDRAALKQVGEAIAQQGPQVGRANEDADIQLGRVVEIKHATTRAEIADNELQYLTRVAIATIVMGLLVLALGAWLAISGFYQWWHKVQKLQDAILVNEARLNAVADSQPVNSNL